MSDFLAEQARKNGSDVLVSRVRVCVWHHSICIASPHIGLTYSSSSPSSGASSSPVILHCIILRDIALHITLNLYIALHCIISAARAARRHDATHVPPAARRARDDHRAARGRAAPGVANVLFCYVMLCYVMFCSMRCFTRFIWSCFVSFYSVLFSVLFCSILFCSVLFGSVQCRLFGAVLFVAVLLCAARTHVD